MQLTKVQPKTTDPQIDQKTSDYIRDNLYAHNTLASYKHDLTIFSRWAFSRKLTVPTVQDIIDFFTDMKQTKKITTLNRYKVALNKVYSDLLKEPDIKDFFKALNNDMASIPKHSKPLLVKDFRRLIQKVPSNAYQLMFTLQFKGAFRISEVLALTVNDCVITEKGLDVTVHRTKTSKEGFTLGLQEKGIGILELFKYHINHNKLSGDDKLFTVKRGSINDYIQRYIGLEYTSHSFRAGHITSCIKDRRNIAAIMKTTGHKHSDTLVNNYYTPANIYENTTDIG